MPPCFKAYDIRGRVPDELDADLAWRIGQAYARVIHPCGPVVVGEDIRLSSPELARGVVRGLNEAGVDTRSLGLCGTETVYHAASLEGMGGGIMVTASHNPMDYNGMKLVRAGAVPVSGDSGLKDIGRLAASGDASGAVPTPGEDRPLDVTGSYVERVLGFVERERLAPLHLVVNAGNGAAGPTFDALVAHLPFRVTRIHHAPDGHFPNGIPNPLLPENREVTAHAVRVHGADLGIAWDGDFDRCFLFDENGAFIEGYYMVGLLAERMLEKVSGGRVIHDPRLVWNTRDRVRAAGGVAVMSKTGHAFIKERMRREDAVYGGEMSAHHYFRGFSYCDSGMIPWLLTTEAMSLTGRPLSDLVAECQRAYPCSGEINFRVPDTEAVMERVRTTFAPQGPEVDETDGLSMAFADWRFNLRSSNTEPVIRLNVETRGDPVLLQERTRALEQLIRE
ncbi:MAG: phosphomannomutase [Ectothiorhodospira sp.]